MEKFVNMHLFNLGSMYCTLRQGVRLFQQCAHYESLLNIIISRFRFTNYIVLQVFFLPVTR